MAHALEDYDLKRLEIIGFRGSAKSTIASLASPLWAALEHPDTYPFIIRLADTRGQASINAASVPRALPGHAGRSPRRHRNQRKIGQPRLDPRNRRHQIEPGFDGGITHVDSEVRAGYVARQPFIDRMGGIDLTTDTQTSFDDPTARLASVG
jgi:hypothetical protein